MQEVTEGQIVDFVETQTSTAKWRRHVELASSCRLGAFVSGLLPVKVF